jgi:transposase
MSTKIKMLNYIAKDKDIFVGLEDSKATWKLAVRCDKTPIANLSMPTEYAVLSSYFRNNYPGCRIHVIYEAGFQGFWLHDLLIKDNISCVVVPPHTVTEEKANRVKTDRIDARRLALNLENGDYKTCYIPDVQRREDRQVSRTLEDIQEDIVRTRNRMWKMLDFHGIAVPFSKQRPTKEDIRQLRHLEISPTLAIALAEYLDELEFYWERDKKLRDILKQMTKSERYKKTFELLLSTPGIGWYTAIRLVLEWGEDLTRFANRRKIASFVGLTCSEYSTGETVRRGHLTGLGHRRSRQWLVESTWTAVRKDPALREKYNRVYRNSGSKKKAIVAAARKLVGRILYCVTHNQPYVVGLVATGCNA